MRTSADYGGGITEASTSALLELALALKAYKDSLVLIGGWAPYYLVRDLGRGGYDHIGSIDIDLAVDPERIDSKQYATIVDLLTDRGYSARRSRDGEVIPFSFQKGVQAPGGGPCFGISVDFLTCEIEGMKGHRHRKVQDSLPARTANGCELAFGHNQNVTIEGTLPGNGNARAEVRTLDLPGCIGMKGIVLGERYKEKDAYDIFSVVSQCLEGPESVGSRVGPFMGEGAMIEGIGNIAEKFRSIDAEGPSWVGTFMHPDDEEQRKRAQAESFVLVGRFLRIVNGQRR